MLHARTILAYIASLDCHELRVALLAALALPIITVILENGILIFVGSASYEN